MLSVIEKEEEEEEKRKKNCCRFTPGPCDRCNRIHFLLLHCLRGLWNTALQPDVMLLFNRSMKTPKLPLSGWFILLMQMAAIALWSFFCFCLPVFCFRSLIIFTIEELSLLHHIKGHLLLYSPYSFRALWWLSGSSSPNIRAEIQIR